MRSEDVNSLEIGLHNAVIACYSAMAKLCLFYRVSLHFDWRQNYLCCSVTCLPLAVKKSRCKLHKENSSLNFFCRLNDVFNDKRDDASQYMITVKHTGLVGIVIQFNVMATERIRKG